MISQTKVSFDEHTIKDLLMILDMFRAMKNSTLSRETAFAVNVGASSKATEATWHVLEPSDVISIIGMLNGGSATSAIGNIGAASVVGGGVPETKSE
jgi:trehalose 6-phosphate synthase/phosphatase